MHLYRRLLGALVILLGGMYEVLADWPREGFRAPLGTGFGRYLIEDIGVHGHETKREARRELIHLPEVP
jgi:hypothetical protein